MPKEPVTTFKASNESIRRKLRSLDLVHGDPSIQELIFLEWIRSGNVGHDQYYELGYS